MDERLDGASPTGGMKPMRILICEDEFIVALTTRTQLEAAGHQVVGTARTAAQCVAMVLEKEPDLVLMDIGLAEGNGIEATRAIMEQHPLPVVIVTAYGDDRVAAAIRLPGVLGKSLF